MEPLKSPECPAALDSSPEVRIKELLAMFGMGSPQALLFLFPTRALLEKIAKAVFALLLNER